MTEHIKFCPVCKSASQSPFITTQDYTVTQETFHIVTCNDCGLRFTNPRPREREIGQYYQSEDYISHSNTKKGIINKVYHIVRKIALKEKLAILNRLIPQKGSVLDIGCGTGYFLSACKNNGWQISGVEVNEHARKQAESLTGFRINENLLDVKKKNFDCVTAWHVIEHIYNLDESLKFIAGILKDDGYAIIAVPNSDSWDAKHYGDKWAGYDVPRHLYHFTQDVIKNIMSKRGFEWVETLPMKFDSYYVSMLSEKYTNNGKAKITEWIKNGYQSNKQAETNQSNYSSLIYIFKKVSQ